MLRPVKNKMIYRLRNGMMKTFFFPAKTIDQVRTNKAIRRYDLENNSRQRLKYA